MLPESLYTEADAERIRGCVDFSGIDKTAQDWLDSLKTKGVDLLGSQGISPERAKDLGYGALGGALGGGILAYIAERRAQRHRHPRDRTSAIGQALTGAVLGGLAVPTGMEAWRRLKPSFSTAAGGGGGEEKPQTLLRSLREGWGFTAGGAAALGRGAYHGTSSARAFGSGRARRGEIKSQLAAGQSKLDVLGKYIRGRRTSSSKPFNFSALGYETAGLPRDFTTTFKKLTPERQAALKGVLKTEAQKLRVLKTTKPWFYRQPGAKAPSGWVTLATALGAPMAGAFFDSVRHGRPSAGSGNQVRIQ